MLAESTKTGLINGPVLKRLIYKCITCVSWAWLEWKSESSDSLNSERWVTRLSVWVAVHNAQISDHLMDPVLLLLSAWLRSVFVVLHLLKHWHITSFTVEESAINPRKWANGGFTSQSQPPTTVLSFCPERTACLERNHAQAKMRTKTFLPPKKQKKYLVATVNLPSVEMCRWRWKEPD